jgi:hypothetical protein
MNLGFLILADSSEAINGKLYALGAGWNELRLPSLPQEYAFSIALAIDVPWSETNRRHELSLHVQDPDGEVIGQEFTMELEAGRPAGGVEGADQRIVISLGTSLAFSTTGPHAAVISVGEEEIGRSRFYVREAPQEMTSPELLQ